MIARPALLAVLAAASLYQEGGASRPVEVDVPIELFVTVTDSDGLPVRGLAVEDFEVLDAGVPVEVLELREGPKHFNGAVLFDVSGSMNLNADRLRAAASEIGAHLQDGDLLLVATLAGGTRLAPRAAASRTDVIRDVSLLSQAAGSTPLWDAMADVMDALATTAGRRVIVVYTDGRANGNRTDANTIAARAVAQGYQVYFLTPWEENAPDVPGFIPPQRVLEQFARATGGATLTAKGKEGALTMLGGRRPSELGSMFGRVLREVRSQYALTFKPAAGSGGFRSLDVRVTRPGLVARTRAGHEALR